MTRDEAITQMAGVLEAKHLANVEQATVTASALGGTFTPPPLPDFVAQATRMIDDQAAEMAYGTIVASLNV
jgi:hypothetical protein